ncbi:unnamed protein product, partial [Meganyctiphanes norvegica]
ICDDVNDCHTGSFLSDEYGCESSCPLEKDGDRFFKCKDGRCLPEVLRCDKKVDCLNGEDEFNCKFASCKNDGWQCRSGQCIPANKICDLKYDCLDKSDEINCGNNSCSNGERQCNNGQCIPSHWWCDWR